MAKMKDWPDVHVEAYRNSRFFYLIEACSVIDAFNASVLHTLCFSIKAVRL